MNVCAIKNVAMIVSWRMFRHVFTKWAGVPPMRAAIANALVDASAQRIRNGQGSALRCDSMAMVSPFLSNRRRAFDPQHSSFN